ncbi:MAG: hypothetical protein M1839_007873 [Geoglossum umbratile]|nr:MAG: hypothetical protein M1839_007873 [Geoglossum umbratile]
MAGIGAGRVLSKLQLGILLWSFELYRNTITELSYPHDEYINKFAPTFHHVPTDTPERHATGLIINHNPAELYMVEAWFQTQGRPAIVELKQNNYTRVAVGFVSYLMLYAGETYLALKNAATATGHVFLAAQAVCVGTWLVASLIVQVKRGQGSRYIELNTLHSTEYRCLTLSTLGENVSSATLSFHLNNLQGYKIYGSKYEQPMLAFAGVLILLSAAIDIMSTVLIVGLTNWAYPWIGLEVAIIVAKVAFCLEPLRENEIKRAPSLECLKVCTDYIVLDEPDAGLEWKSTTAGLWIGQEYTATNSHNRTYTKYLALQDQKLALIDQEPVHQKNQALQREFLAALKVIVDGNKVPSEEFITAIDRTLEGVEATMDQEWYTFGAKDALESVAKAKTNLWWRRYL